MSLALNQFVAIHSYVSSRVMRLMRRATSLRLSRDLSRPEIAYVISHCYAKQMTAQIVLSNAFASRAGMGASRFRQKHFRVVARGSSQIRCR